MKHRRIFLSVVSVIMLGVISILTIINIYGKSAKKSSGCSGGGCMGCNGCGSQGQINSTYYKNKQEQLLDTLEGRQKIFRSELLKSHTEKEITEISKETTEEFIKLIPQLPYIGGDDNVLTEDIELAAMVLAFYRVEKKLGRSVEEVGGIIYNAIKGEMSKYPKWLLRLSGRKYFTATYIEKLKKDTEESQKKLYSGDWLTTFVPGDGKQFDYGYNHTECGILKFFREQDAEELTPFLCKLDYVYSDSLDEGLVRTSTLAEGGKYCDFRLKRVENDSLDMLVAGTAGMIIVSIALTFLFIVRKILINRKRSISGLSS
ncbi:MAG: L-2-amino-thiazoline-4-carboxylic acid hydrolase [Clostridia bacterium]|nr:L-2-amino-thiazoline-4-carboxylic acid hydrolase [Clostridia bacterium]